MLRYKVRFLEIIKFGVGPLHLYKYSHVKAILSVYPGTELIYVTGLEYPWKVWKFKSLPKFFLDDEQIVKTMFEQMKRELGIYEHEVCLGTLGTHLQDWYEVTRIQLMALKFEHVLTKYGGYIEVLQHFFPHEQWDKTRLRKMKTQNILFRFIK